MVERSLNHKDTKRAGSAGFTLMELLVVLIIIGVLSTVAVRTIEATRNRALFDRTMGEMQELVQAMVGNPYLTMDGRRVDYGYYGDMGRLPDSLRNLVENIGDGELWKGPYLRRRFTGDSLGYLFDGWGNPYTYIPETGIITTIGDGNHPMSVRVADTLDHLTDNSIVGTVADADNNPPNPGQVNILLALSSGAVFPIDTDPSGYYSVSQVPIGTHRLVAYHLYDSITRWVSVSPRTRNVIDFRFSQPFRDFLQMVGQPQLFEAEPPRGPGFVIQVVNRHELDLSITGVELAEAPDNAYFREFTWDGVMLPNYPVPSDPPPPGDGFGRGDTMWLNRLDPGYSRTIRGRQEELVPLGFFDCRVDPDGTGGPADIAGQPFRLRFSDGSMIEFALPNP